MVRFRGISFICALMADWQPHARDSLLSVIVEFLASCLGPIFHGCDFSKQEQQLRKVILAVAYFAIFLGLWLLFVNTTKADELSVGLAASAIAAYATLLVRTEQALRFSPTLEQLLQGIRLLWYLLSGTGEIMVVLAKQLLGIGPAKSLWQTKPFDVGGEDPNSLARRVLAIAYTCAAPNFIVGGIDKKRGLLLYHQVEKSGVPIMTQKLGAHP